MLLLRNVRKYLCNESKIFSFVSVRELSAWPLPLLVRFCS